MRRLAVLAGWSGADDHGGVFAAAVAEEWRCCCGCCCAAASSPPPTAQADRGLAGSMEGHAAMDMSVQRDGTLGRRLFSGEAFTAVSHVFVMEWAAIWKDLVGGLLIAGAIGAWVPNAFWQQLFLTDNPTAAAIWGPLIGPLVAVISFVCSIGNVPLAVVLWTGGISFGGVVAFIFADLIILPILNIYRRYYGTGMALFLAGTFYTPAALARGSAAVMIH